MTIHKGCVGVSGLATSMNCTKQPTSLHHSAHPFSRFTVIHQEVDVGKLGWFIAIVIWVIIFPISLVLVLGILLAFMMGGGA